MSAIHCLFCGGAACKWENHKLWPKNAIEGLFSNWIDDRILAMQRPSSRIIAEYKIVDKFREQGISAVFNLQQAGEHASCGDNIHPGGFAYRPEEFMDEGIFYYNFSWTDMQVPPVELITNLVQVMDASLNGGKKIAVHCHAGLGRTGLAIACYYVFSQSTDAVSAILQVRANRPLSVQTTKQVEFIHQFEEHLRTLRQVFPGISSKTQTTRIPTESLTLTSMLLSQRQVAHGIELRSSWHVPLIVIKIIPKLKIFIQDPAALASVCKVISEFQGHARLDVKSIVFQCDLNMGKWDVIQNETDHISLVKCLLYWILTLKEPLLSSGFLEYLSTKAMEGSKAMPPLKKEEFYTLKAILNLFQTCKDPAAKNAIHHLAIFVTPLRSTIEFPYQHWQRVTVVPKSLPDQMRMMGSKMVKMSSKPSETERGPEESTNTLSVPSPTLPINTKKPVFERVPVGKISPELKMVAETFLDYLLEEDPDWESFESRQENGSSPLATPASILPNFNNLIPSMEMTKQGMASAMKTVSDAMPFAKVSQLLKGNGNK